MFDVIALSHNESLIMCVASISILILLHGNINHCDVILILPLHYKKYKIQKNKKTKNKIQIQTQYRDILTNNYRYDYSQNGSRNTYFTLSFSDVFSIDNPIFIVSKFLDFIFVQCLKVLSACYLITFFLIHLNNKM
jgi:hypothetical protein